MKKRRILRWKYLVPLIAGMLVMSLAFVLISFLTFRDIEIKDYENYARGLTGLIRDEIIDVDHIDEYLEQGRDYPGYAEAEDKLYHLRDAYPDVVFLYIYQVQPDGFHVVFDLDTKDVKGKEPGKIEPFSAADREHLPELTAGQNVPSIMSSDQYGDILSVMTPMYDGNGVCVAYVGADCSMEILTEYVWSIIRNVAYAFLIVLALALIAAVAVTEYRVRKMEKLTDKAYTDTLTGLQNRAAFYERMEKLTRKMGAGTADFSILMIDVNYLKRMNDVYGHEQGNLYLQGGADLMRKCFGEDDLYRIGGDEFTVLLDGKAQEGADDRIRAFKDEIARLQADDTLNPWEKVSAAVGLARYNKEEHQIADEVLRQADEKMYADKVAMKAVRTD